MSDSELKALRIKMGQIKAQLTRFNNYLNAFDPTKSVFELTKRLENIERLWDEFGDCQSRIELLDETELNSDQRSLFEKDFYENVSQAQEYISTAQASTTTETNKPVVSSFNDLNVYTVGPDYAHAEARKSPALDGKVERDRDGKEIRYPVILSNAEKLISRKVCLAFKQAVCGFDLLRANGKSFVCDVNGFSFVKNSNKYYDDCAKILGNMILRELAPTLHIPWSVPFQLDDPPIVPTTFGKMMELRCVVAVIRHGDRTPKQKMKVEVRHPKFFEIFEKYDGYKHGHVKLKRPKQLQEILDIARSLLAEIQQHEADPEIEEKQGKLEQLKAVLEMYGHFSGINRKVQMKYQPKGRPRGSSSDDVDKPAEPSLVLILKWGGELTPAGRIQAEELGRIFRCMYPGGQGRHLAGLFKRVPFERVPPKILGKAFPDFFSPSFLVLGTVLKRGNTKTVVLTLKG
ncbi:hypothetical protein NQ318_010261 [Aromia moschata]|uniref:Inositol hexakisphosphate and diphosphoinositol-pentakisphosphate kinase n=1 Tax=Aromia moschata TaxID=1265417 RepID=A0AAV8YIZ0_9CUCU|nr:hypothetical protein NQ318_010261 [Aromia moschata]